ncbi:MAG: BatA domain-containing protein [Cyclobacteriaceae bacterium]
MIFQYPSFLWALAALAIPIIIHLFNFRKTITVYFSSTRFLKQVKQETTQKRKLKQYLVLASRLLFLLFLVLAFAQPFLPASEQVADQKRVTIYLDNSLSMSAPVAEKTRALDDAIQRAREIVDVFPADVQFQIITNDFAAFSNSFKAKAEVIDYLSQVRLSAISRQASEIAARVLQRNTSLFWLSDFQASTFGSGTFLDSALATKLIPITFSKPSNVFIDTLYLENPFVIGGEKNSVKVQLRNQGEKRVEGLITKLFINEVQTSAVTVDMEPNSSQLVSFDLPGSLKGINRALVSFSDYPVSFDNEFYFTLNYSGKIRVIEIKSTTEVTPVERVFGNKELFSVASFPATNINYNLLSTADLIVVNQLDKIDPTLQAALSNLKQGTSIVVVPGSRLDISSYRSFLGNSISINEDKNQIWLSPPDFQNPFFQNVFEDKNPTMAMPVATKMLEWGNDRSAMLQFKDGRPFLSKVGNYYVLSCPLEKRFTDFGQHALFVPVMYRLAALATRSQQMPYYSLSAPTISIAADSIETEEPVKMVGKVEVIPSQRKLSNRLVLEVPKYELEKGFYQLQFRTDTLTVIAYNLDKSESYLESLKAEEAKARLGGHRSITLFDNAQLDDFRSELKNRYLGTPLWKYALLLSLFFLLAEVLLLRFLK